MKTTLVISLLMAGILCGCIHTSVVRTDSPEFDKLQLSLPDKKIQIKLKPGSAMTLKVTRSTPDTLTGISPEGKTLHIPMENVSAIQVVDRGAGTAKGFGYGLLGGVVIGGLAAASLQSDDNPLEEAFASSAVILSAGLGALGGALVGAAAGDRHIYQIIQSDEVTSSPNQAVPSPVEKPGGR